MLEIASLASHKKTSFCYVLFTLRLVHRREKTASKRLTEICFYACCAAKSILYVHLDKERTQRANKVN